MKNSNKENNIALIGFMGCGKTTIGKILSSKINYLFIDTDREIEQEAGISITQIFEKHGEEYFRELETKVLKSILENENQVIATGGGIIKNSNNVAILKKSATTIYLKSTPEQLYENIKDSTHRPLLQCDDPFSQIKTLLEERRSLYETAKDITVDTSSLSLHQCTNTIIHMLNLDNLKQTAFDNRQKQSKHNNI